MRFLCDYISQCIYCVAQNNSSSSVVQRCQKVGHAFPRALNCIFEYYFLDLRALPCIYSLRCLKKLYKVDGAGVTVPSLQMRNLKLTDVESP